MKKNRVIAIFVTGTMLAAALPWNTFAAEEEAISKKETVYVLADASGNAEKVIVSDQFTGVSPEDAGAHMNGLSGVENVKGDDYWQGISDQPENLPVQIKVTYTLDGTPVDASDLEGKSGHLVTRFDFTNTKEQAASDGQMRYVPFLVLAGQLMDGDTAEHVEAVNGKVLNFGEKTIVLGYAFPGLKEDLQLKAEETSAEEEETLRQKLSNAVDDLEIPDYVEISADVTDYEQPATYALVSNAVFQEGDGDDLKTKFDFSGLMDDFDELTDGISQLADGSGQLKDGLSDLLDGCNDLSDGVSQLKDGLDTLDENSEALNDGATQVFEALLQTAQTQIEAAGLSVDDLTIETYDASLDGILEYLDGAEDLAEETARGQVEAAVNARAGEVEAAVTAAVQEEVTAQVSAAVQEEVTAQVTEAVKAQVWAQVLESQELDEVTYEQGVAAGLISKTQQTMLQAALDAQMESEEVLALRDANVQQQMASQPVQATIASHVAEQMQTEQVQSTIAENIQAQIESLVEENLNSEEVQNQIAAAMQQVTDGKAQIEGLKEQLASFQTFYDGLAAYTGGVATAAEGATTLNDNMPDLVSGVSDLSDGADALAEGIQTLQEEGIQKLEDFLDQDLTEWKDQLSEVLDLSKEYTSFTETEEGMESSVRFIYKIS